MAERAKDRSTGLSLRRLAAVIAVALAALAGCSSLRFGYDNADTLLFYKLDSYVDLNHAQSQLVRERLHGLFAWHRATQLPGYAEFLDAAGQRLDSHVASTDVYQINLEINRRLLAVGDHAATDLAALALTLEPRQVDRLERKLADDNAKSRDEAGGATRRGLEHRVKRSVARTEEWFGSVTPKQREIIRATLADQPDREEAWVQEREQRRADLLTVARRIQAERPAVETATQWIRDYFATLAEPRDAERQTRQQEYRHANAALIASLVNAATPEQKNVLRRKLRGYAEDFAALARPGRS